MTSLEGKNALVTGASVGIGRAIATSLARMGCNLILTSRDESKLKELARELKATHGDVSYIPADLTTVSGRSAVVEAAQGQGALTYFIHCASAQVDPETEALLQSMDSERIDETISATLTTAAHLLHDLLPLLSQSIPSNAFLFSSDWALAGSEGPAVFSAAKAGLLHLARSVRDSFRKEGVLLTVLIPGDTATYDENWTEPVWTIDNSVEEVISAHGSARIPLIDIVETVEYVINRKLCNVYEIYLSPIDPSSS